jgi:glutaconate CoA-transferase subunit A
MRDKRTTLDDAVAGLRDGMTIGIGGWGSRRKPMALLEAILRTPARDLTVVSFGGPDVGMLCAAGKVREVVFGFVSLDSIAYDPYFARARQDGAITVRELDEGMVVAGLGAAAQRLPFLPIRAGLGSDVLTYYPGLRTVRSPYADGEELVAMPALPLDMAFVHLNRADPHGNAAYLGPDPYFDDLFCLAAKYRVLSAERVVPTAELVAAAPPQALLLNRMMVDAVVEAPGGAGFTSCVPDYGRDEAAQREYVAGAKA